MNNFKIKYLLIFVLGLMTNYCFATTGAPIQLESVNINLKNHASVIRGAKYFAKNCMACHTMRYLYHDALAQRAGITKDKMPLNDQKWWYGSPPPDLTLIAQVHSSDWLYTFLHSFYQDKEAHIGSNNLLVPNIGMPNPFSGLQGTQMLLVSKEDLLRGKVKNLPYYSVLKLETQGSMTPEEFDQTMTDLVNFLVYASDPESLHRKAIGWWILGFLIIFAILTFLLKQA